MTDKPKDVFAEAAALSLKKFPPRIVTISQSKADFERIDPDQKATGHTFILGGQEGHKPFSHTAFELRGKDFAMLTELELNLFRVLRDTGRKLGIVVSVCVIDDDERIQAELAAASPQQQEEIYRRLRTQVWVDWAIETTREE